MRASVALISFLAAFAVGRAPTAATITAAPAPGPHNHHHPRQEQPPSPSPSPSPSPTRTPSCVSSLTSLLASLPAPTPTALSAWAASSAPIQLVLRAIASNYAFPALILPNTDTDTDTDIDIDIDILCTAAARAATAPPDLAAAYAAYLDAVQRWRFAVEGDAYELAERCGGEVGLGLELLMATEAAMCTSGLRESVVPWATGVVDGDGMGPAEGTGTVEGNAAAGLRMGGVMAAVGFVGVLVAAL
ncbi:hypothetical protein BT67DRAFT_130518 [Trichocladium antarcticum]|uniref:Infection structure specific protein n=1 Tax=Trichocladium antarcticum TaxID=1450529 RepID=A0AAN6USW4_9PEZI|nr:hypothetical protein BT67DRAFT_130518 [Trichocladium antarcticum]